MININDCIGKEILFYRRKFVGSLEGVPKYELVGEVCSGIVSEISPNGNFVKLSANEFYHERGWFEIILMRIVEVI